MELFGINIMDEKTKNIVQNIHNNAGQIAGSVGRDQVLNQNKIYIGLEKKSFDKLLFVDTKNYFCGIDQIDITVVCQTTILMKQKFC